MNTNSEKREYERKNGLIIAEYTTPDGNANGLIRNISAGGLFIRTAKKPLAGQSIILRFPFLSLKKISRSPEKCCGLSPPGLWSNSTNRFII